MAGELDQIEDELLVVEAQCGDRACLDLLVDRWAGRVRGLALRLTGDEAGADDVAQETWAAAARGLIGLRDPARFGPWIGGIARRKAADWIGSRRRDRRMGRLVGEPYENGRIVGTASGFDGEEIGRLRRAIRGLPAERRAILFLFYMEGLSVGQIAELMGVPRGTVKSRMHQARAELRGLMADGLASGPNRGQEQGDGDGKH